MRIRIKAAALALAAGLIALSTGTCLFRLMGDTIGDQIVHTLIK